MEYEIGGKKYRQEKITPGQAEQLWDLFKGLDPASFPTDLNPGAIYKALGPDLYKSIGIILREDGKERWWEKDLDAMAETLKWQMSVETGVEIVNDFFVCNQISSLSASLNAFAANLIRSAMGKTPSQPLSSSSPEEISDAETKSDGA